MGSWKHLKVNVGLLAKLPLLSSQLNVISLLFYLIPKIFLNKIWCQTESMYTFFVLNWPWKPLNEWRPIGSLRLRLRIEDRGVLPPWHTFANGPSTVSLGLQQRPDIAVTRLLLLRDYVRPVWGLSLSLSWWSADRRPGFGPHSLCQGLGRLRPPQSSWGPTPGHLANKHSPTNSNCPTNFFFGRMRNHEKFNRTNSNWFWGEFASLG